MLGKPLYNPYVLTEQWDRNICAYVLRVKILLFQVWNISLVDCLNCAQILISHLYKVFNSGNTSEHVSKY